jgi:hypothetical protein
MNNLSYALKRIIDYLTHIRPLHYGLVVLGVGLLTVVATGFQFGLQIITSNGPLSFTFSTDAGLPAVVTYTITATAVGLILFGLVGFTRDWKQQDRKRVFVIELRGLRDWNGPRLSESVPRRLVGRREDFAVDLRQGISDGRIDNPEVAIKKIAALRTFVDTRESGLDRNDICYVFGGLASVPLTFLAGIMLDDESPLTLMDWDRNQKIWRDLVEVDDGRRFTIDGLERVPNPSPTVVVAISASYRANIDGAKRKWPGIPLVHLELENASTTSHWSQEKQEALSQQFLDTMIKLESSGVKEVHLVFAGPSSLVARFGSHYDKRNLPSLLVYQYEQQAEPPFTWGIRMPVAGREQAELV